jgi:hypothetical protein
VSANDTQVIFLYLIPDDRTKIERGPLLYLYQSQGDWIMWTKEGYYAASPGGERLMGWTVDNGPNKLPTFHPADRFRKQLYRPGVIKLVLEKGSVLEALKAAASNDKARPVELNTLLPPKVSVEVMEQKAPLVKLRVRATASKTQRVTSLRLLVDGRPLTASEGYAEFKAGKEQAEVEWTITLPGEKQAGPYRLAVLARSQDASAFSNAVDVTYVNKAKLPTLHVLAIGINDDKSDRSLKLDAAVPDARAIKEAFE